jgi:MFS transporter, DHA1 family, tetracycline resistance protein
VSSFSAQRKSIPIPPLRFIEPWYAVYGLMGFLVAGVIPILLPLLAGSQHGPVAAGVTVAAVSLGGLTAPLWGGLADRQRWHKRSLVAGLAAAAAAMALLPFTTQPAVWFVLAILIGAGSAAAATVANLFIVEAHPQAEWDERIGWLQTFYGVGQAAGLLAAAAMSGWDMRAAWGLAAAVCAAAALLGWLTTDGVGRRIDHPVLIYPPRHAEGSILSPQSLFHSLDRRTPGRLGGALRSPFGIFLLTWLLSIGGSAAVFSQYPLLMQHVFGIGPAASSIGFGAAAGLGMFLYAPAGGWGERIGPARIYRIGLGIRGAAFLGMIGLAASAPESGGRAAIPIFGVAVLAWSLIGVSGTAITARFSPRAEGEGMGIFNAVNALANIAGAAAGGWLAGALGYASLIGLAAAGAAGGLFLAVWVRPAPPAASAEGADLK